MSNCGRVFAPYVNHVVCIDTISAMLEIGKVESKKSGLSQI
ncbi:hypothetical protein [uncultured Clostridium sp.]|nr:hypothetical protein [uncultured Clostridium sp.]